MSPPRFHQRVADALRRQSTVSANIKNFLRLAFHLARCAVLSPFVNVFRRKKFARRKRGYLMEMRALLHQWRSRAALRIPFASSAVEKCAPSRSGTLFGTSMPECLEVANK